MLQYLIDEICAAIEVYYTGRLGGQYMKMVYILCDDYTELAAKLFLITDNPNWSEKKWNQTHTRQHYKNYYDILDDVEAIFTNKYARQLNTVKEYHRRLKERRGNRNAFFHKTKFLDLNINQRGVVEAFCDLNLYGQLLFSDEWGRCINNSRNLNTMHLLLLLESKSFSNPAIWNEVMEIIRYWPRNKKDKQSTGVHQTEFPEDFHLRMCVIYGYNELYDRLKQLVDKYEP